MNEVEENVLFIKKSEFTKNSKENTSAQSSNAESDKRKVKHVTQEKKDFIDKVMDKSQIKTAIKNCQKIRQDKELVNKNNEGASCLEMSASEKKLIQQKPLIEMPKISRNKSGEMDKNKQEEIEEETKLVSWMDDKTIEKVYGQSEIQILQTLKSKVDLELANDKLKNRIAILESEKEHFKKKLTEYESKKIVTKNLCTLCGIKDTFFCLYEKGGLHNLLQ